MKKRIRYILFLVIITPICLELALRILGYGAYHQTEYSIVSKPNMCLEASADLGFSLGEGVYSVSMNGAPAYTATHIDGQRITGNSAKADSLPDVFVMGCSFTYGMGVDDSLSFPYQLQQAFSNVDIRNFGVPGFGSVQSYLQLKEEIATGNIPEMVVVNFCDFHHERNSLTPRYRNSLVLGYQRSNEAASKALKKSGFPYIENDTIKTVDYDKLYSNWPGRETFATVHYFQSMSDKSKESNINLVENSLSIFQKIKALCEKHEVHLIVTGLTKNKDTQQFLRQLRSEGFQTVDISLNLENKKYNQLPYDTHPNGRAHTYFAKKLTPVLAEWINLQFPAN
ncbi:MAG: hypothetical protein HWE22_10265 [Flavobacteriales bacterium]|nr:hypothetical protein [Flavobacteriales bacterium]